MEFGGISDDDLDDVPMQRMTPPAMTSSASPNATLFAHEDAGHGSGVSQVVQGGLHVGNEHPGAGVNTAASRVTLPYENWGGTGVGGTGVGRLSGLWRGFPGVGSMVGFGGRDARGDVDEDTWGMVAIQS